MRPYISIILCASLLLASCTSLDEVRGDEGLAILRKGNSELVVTLKTGRVIGLEAGRYLFVSEPGTYYYGNGLLRNYRTSREIRFRGKIAPVGTAPDTADRVAEIRCWRDDSTAVIFRAGDYVRVTPETGTGLYVFGRDSVISPDDIALVEVKKIDVLKSVLIGASISGIAMGFLFVQGIKSIGQN